MSIGISIHLSEKTSPYPFQCFRKDNTGAGNVDALKSFPGFSEDTAAVKPQFGTVHDDIVKLLYVGADSVKIKPDKVGTLRLVLYDSGKLFFDKSVGKADIIPNIGLNALIPHISGFIGSSGRSYARSTRFVIACPLDLL